MKTKHIFAALGAALMVTFTGCKEEDFFVPSAENIPLASDYEDMVRIDIDPETNNVTFNLDAPGVMPVWILDGKTYSTVNGMSKIYLIAGEYEIEMKVLNRNGVSDGSIFKKFVIENTIFDFDRYYSLLAGNGSREWRVDNKAKGHLGCGEPGTDGLNWWSAGADEKSAEGLYDNRLMFSKDSQYTFKPGNAGTIYVNKEVSRFEGHDGSDPVDFNVPATEQTTTYKLEPVGADLYLVLEKGAFFPYIANNDIYDTPRYRIENLTASELVLVSDNGGIAWHYIFTSKAPEQGSDAPAAENLFKPENLALASCWWANNDWGEITAPTVDINNGTATITVNEANGGNQWQGQVHLNTQVAIEEGQTYNFAITLNPTQALTGATVKPHPEGDDGHMFSERRHDLNPYEDNVIEYKNFTADFSTTNLVITLDFPGCQAGTVIEVKDITVSPAAPAAAGGATEEVPMTAFGLASCWWANNDWGEITAPDVAIDGNSATITVKEANGFNQWQGQVHLNTGIVIAEGETYDFAITLTPSTDLGGATVKPHPEGDDGHMFSEARHDLMGYEDNVIEYKNFTADFSTSNLVITLDFPGSPAGTVIEVKNIKVAKHVEGAAPATGENVMGTLALASCWWANNDWGEITAPEVVVNNNTATITVKEANGFNQWQGQVHFNTGTVVEEGAVYNFRLTLTPSADLNGATVKPHPEGDDGHMFSEARHNLVAYDDNVVEYLGVTADFSTSNLVITLDFPGCPAGTVIEVKDIAVEKL